MSALGKLRRATNCVCDLIERPWRKSIGWRIKSPNYLLEPLEKRQLLSVAAAISGPATVAEGENYVLDLTASSTAATYTVNHWIIGYGDGNTHTLTGDSVADLYAWETYGTFDITATVEDTEYGTSYSASTSLDVTVTEATPSLYLSSDEMAVVGEEFNEYDGLSDGGIHSLSLYQMAWGDGTSSTDSTTPETITNGYADDFSHTYAEVGTYTATGTAVDDGVTYTASDTLTAVPLGVGDAGNGYVSGDDYAITPTFHDPGQTLDSYIVSFGDGSADQTYSSSATTFAHTYADNGGGQGYEATVEAIASDGTWTSDYSAEPLAAVWPDSTPVDRGDTVNLDGGFYANGDDPTQWVVDWGDSTTATYADSSEMGYDSEQGIGGPLDATHTYSADGTYTIEATADDTVSAYAADAATIVVDEPTATFTVDGDDEFTKNVAYDLTPSFTISSNDTPGTYYVGWGDGSSEQTYAGSATEFSHTYTDGVDAPYTPTVSLTTDFGTYTASTEVDEVPPDVSISGATSVSEGATLTETASFSDPNGNTPTGWALYWGDGVTSNITGDPASFTHVYTATLPGTGPYTIMAAVDDEDGEYWADDVSVTVTPSTATIALSGSTATAGSQFSLTETFTDPDALTPYDWTVNFGDDSGSYFFDGSDPALTHTYAGEGTYDATAWAVDPNGTYSSTHAVTVAAAGTYGLDVEGEGLEGEPTELAYSFTDPGGASPTLSTVYWGDGNSNTYGANPDYFDTQSDDTYAGTYDHTYTSDTHSTYSVTAIAQTEDGTYTAYALAAANNEINFMAGGALNPADGEPYAVEGFFSPDQAGNEVASYPIAGHDTSYSISWGDGDNSSSSTDYFTHEYTYNPGGDNNYSYTVTAQNDEYTSSYVNVVDVFPTGGGSLSFDGPGSGIEGEAVTAFANLTDSSQPEGEQGAYSWALSWGDGSQSSEGGTPETDFDPTHVYAEPGTYRLSVSAEYEDPDGDFAATTYDYSVVISEAVPSLSFTDSAATLTAGDEWTLDPTYSDSVGDHVNPQMSVSWGDGTTSIYGDIPIPDAVSHIYSSPGDYTPVVTVNAFDNPTAITTTASAVDVVNPTVSISDALGYADESGQGSDEYTISRSGGDFDSPLTVSYSLGGTALSSEYILSDADTGQILTGTATIPAGESDEVVRVTALEDHTPRWTDPLEMTVASSSEYALSAGATTVETDIVNDDLTLYLGDGSGDQVLEASEDSSVSLTPLVFEYPTEDKDGCGITLSIPDEDASLINVWATSSPSDTDVPILGDVSGTYVDSVTWTYGSGDDEPPTDHTFYVEAVNGGPSMTGLQFTGVDTDPDPSTNTATTQPDPDPVAAEIIPLTDPNTTGLSYWNDTTWPLTWLVGQEVNIGATLSGPPSIIDHLPLSYQWSIPDGDNVLEAWSVGPNSTKEYSLSNDDGGSPLGDTSVHTGLKQQILRFFWVSAPPSGASTVSLTISGLPSSETATTTVDFNVYEPVVSNTSLNVGRIGISRGVGIIGVFTGVPSPLRTGDSFGMMAGANVVLPNDYTGIGSFSSAGSQWNFLQLVQYQSSKVEVGGLGDNNYYVSSDPNLYPLLDTAWPARQNISDDWTASMGWQAVGSSTHYLMDAPDFPVYAYSVAYTTNKEFQDYIMFQPSGPMSQWVPLQKGAWAYALDAEGGPNAWYFATKTGPTRSPFAPVMFEPVWTAVSTGTWKYTSVF